MEQNTTTTAEVIPSKAFIGQPQTITGVIKEMYFVYRRTDEFAELPAEKRKEFVDIVCNLIDLFS